MLCLWTGWQSLVFPPTMVFGYCYVAAAVGRILESDIFQQRFFGNDRRVKCFCRIQVSDLHLDSRLRGNDGRGFSKARCSRFQTTICLVGVHRSVGFAHDNGG